MNNQQEVKFKISKGSLFLGIALIILILPFPFSLLKLI